MSQGSSLPSKPNDGMRVKELETRCADLEEQLAQVKRERVEYLQNVSHQLVAPLNAIKWHIENLTEGRLGVERAKSLSDKGVSSCAAA